MRALPIRKAIPLRVRLSLNWPVMKVLGFLAWPHTYLEGHRMRWIFSEGEYDTAATEETAASAHPSITTVSVGSDGRVNGLMRLPLTSSAPELSPSPPEAARPASRPEQANAALWLRLLRWLRRGVR